METKHVVIVGAGFGGLHAVRVLGRDRRLRVTLVDQQNYHLFQPLLYQVAIAGLEAPQVAFPVRKFLRHYSQARFQLGRVEAVEPQHNMIWVGDQPVPYDYLILAPGSKSVDFGIPGVSDHATSMKALPDAMGLRDRVLSACEEAAHTMDDRRRRALLTFVVIGGGPTGVELAGALGELRRHVIPRDYPELDAEQVRVCLLEMAPRLLTHLSESSSAYARDYLGRLGVDVLTETAVAEVRPHEVCVKDGAAIPTFNAIWSAGVGGVELPGVPQDDKTKRVATADALHLHDYPNVYVVGDLSGAVDPESEQPYPQVAPLAMQQGRAAARNVLRALHGAPQQPFSYFDKGNMVTLGRNHAVAETAGMKFTGFPAWAAWLGVHLMYLLGGRNRFMVLSNWAYSYFTYDYAVRVMHRRVTFPPTGPVAGRRELAEAG